MNYVAEKIALGTKLGASAGTMSGAAFGAALMTKAGAALLALTTPIGALSAAGIAGAGALISAFGGAAGGLAHGAATRKGNQRMEAVLKHMIKETVPPETLSNIVEGSHYWRNLAGSGPLAKAVLPAAALPKGSWRAAVERGAAAVAKVVLH